MTIWADAQKVAADLGKRLAALFNVCRRFAC
jgi:hypothetical protein